MGFDGRMDGQTDGHGETSKPPYNFVVGGIINNLILNKGNNKITELRTILQRESQNS